MGSAAGLKRIRTRDIGFGAADVAPVFNLPRVGDGQLRLDGELLASIFLGATVRWNAPEIAALNPGLSLPDLPIRVVVRSDGVVKAGAIGYVDYGYIPVNRLKAIRLRNPLGEFLAPSMPAFRTAMFHSGRTRGGFTASPTDRDGRCLALGMLGSASGGP